MFRNRTTLETACAELDLSVIHINVNAVFQIKPKMLFSIHDQTGVKLLRRPQLKFSHLNNHKSCHKFKDFVSPMCNCGTEIETIKHFFLTLPIPSQ